MNISSTLIQDPGCRSASKSNQSSKGSEPRRPVSLQEPSVPNSGWSRIPSAAITQEKRGSTSLILNYPSYAVTDLISPLQYLDSELAWCRQSCCTSWHFDISETIADGTESLSWPSCLIFQREVIGDTATALRDNTTASTVLILWRAANRQPWFHWFTLAPRKDLQSTWWRFHLRHYPEGSSKSACIATVPAAKSLPFFDTLVHTIVASGYSS